MNIQEAIKHFKYGISHDIFSEPVTSYAKMAVGALRRQIPMKPIGDFNGVSHYCPVCKDTIIVYHDELKPFYCCWCGQKIDWSEE